MKKLIAMIGAVATAFGLFADAYTNSFETQAEGVQEGAFTPGEGWTWAPETTIPVAQYTTKGETKYPYSPDERRFPEGASQENYLDLSTGSDTLFRSVGDGNIFLDQLVKFTGFEENPSFAEDNETKIAVWLKASETEDEDAGETNLYVSVGTASGKTDLLIASNIEPETWHRLTIKSLGDITKLEDGRAGFLIYIDGQQVECDEAKNLFNGSALTTDAAALQEKGLLFPAMIAGNADFATVGYKGIGGIDDVILDQEGPAFTQTVEFGVTVPENFASTVVTNLTAGGPALVAKDGKYTAGNGDQIGILVEANGPVVMDPTWVTKTAAKGTIAVTATDLEGKYEEADVSLVRNSETTYFTQAGFETLLTQKGAVINGDVITVLKSIYKMGDSGMDYNFTPGTAIAIQDVGDPITAVKWNVTVPNYIDEEEVPGALTFNLGLEAEKQIEVTFTADTVTEDNVFTFSGTINAGASLTVNNGAFDAGDIVLVDDAKVYTTDDSIETIVDGAGNKIEAKAVPESNKYVYEIPAAPTTWEATIDLKVGTGVNPPTAKVDGEGDNVDIAEDGTVEVEVGKTLVVTYTAKTGYQFETDVATKSFTLTEESSSCKCPTATAIEYAINIDANGGTGGSANPDVVTVEDTYSKVITLTPPTAPENKEFDKWTSEVGEIDGNTLTLDECPFAAVTVTATYKDKQQDWPDPADVPANTAASTKLPGLVGDDLANADLKDLATWAKTYDVAFNAEAVIAAKDAFLLNCDPMEAEAEMAAYNVTAITQDSSGAWVVTPREENMKGAKYYGVSVTQSSASIETPDWTDGATGPFFRTQLRVKAVTP